MQQAGDEILSLINRVPSSPLSKKPPHYCLPQKELSDPSICLSEESDKRMALHSDSQEEQHLRDSQENLSRSLDSFKVTTQGTQVNPAMVLCKKQK